MVVEPPFKPSILNEQHVAGIIQLIYSRGEILSFELKQVSGNYDKLKGITRELESMGLIIIDVQEKPRLTYVYKLTEKGKKVAEKLQEIEDILKE